MLIDLIILATLVFLSAFFSASEIAIFSLSKLRIQHLAGKNMPAAKTLQRLRNNPDRLLSTILVGNNLVNTAASVLATKVAFKLFSAAGIDPNSSLVLGITTGVMTLLLLLFGEVTPKTLASHHHEKWALGVARPVELLSTIFYPFITFFEFITDKILGIVGKPKWKPTITKEEILSIIEVGVQEGEIKKSERELINHALKLDKTDVKEIVIPRGDMIILDAQKTLQEVWPTILETKKSRYPVYENRRDNIVGVFLVKEAMSKMSEKISETLTLKVNDLARPMMFIPETKQLDALLSDFQKKKMQIAIVVDEHGGIVGLVTMEDVLEQLVGPLYDEMDKIVKNIDKVSQNIFSVKGKSTLEEINKKLGLKIRVEKDIDTISGFILDKIGRIPNAGERLTFPCYDIVIEKVEGNRILEVSVIKK